MADALQSERCAEMLAALAAPERLRIVRFLRDGPRTVGEVAELLHVPSVNASHHLMKLRDAGLICSRKEGRCVIYTLAPDVLHGDPSSAATEHLDLGCCRLELPTPEEK